jgi:CrcB protein
VKEELHKLPYFYLLNQPMIKVLLAIGSGSFLGGISRYLLSRAIQNSVASTFPFGTLWVNIFGCFLIGLLYGLSDRGNLSNNELRLFLTVGFCGGFTTFSTFSTENLALLRDGSFLHFTVYAGLSVFLGLAATFGGHALTKIL